MTVASKLFVVIVLISLAGCAGSSESSRSAEEQFGHRVEGTSADGRETHEITAPDSGEDYAIHPAVFDSVYIRPQHRVASDPDGEPVEILVKGSFPDSCTELHSVEQQRSGNILNVSLDMRRSRSALCASVVRPYRFYFMLDGRYGPGNYTLKINDLVRTFTITDAS